MNNLGKEASSDSDISSEKSVTEKQQRMDERRRNKALQAEQRRKERRIEALEQLISSLEEEIEELNQKMCLEEYMTDYGKLTELSDIIADKKEQLAGAYEEWAVLSE